MIAAYVEVARNMSTDSLSLSHSLSLYFHLISCRCVVLGAMRALLFVYMMTVKSKSDLTYGRLVATDQIISLHGIYTHTHRHTNRRDRGSAKTSEQARGEQICRDKDEVPEMTGLDQ
jgi:hypothetical protein